MEIVAAQLEAKQNTEKIAALIPAELRLREEHLFATFARHCGNPYSKLQDLYSFMDEIYSFVGMLTPCRKSCSHCCHIPVSVSNLEVEYIKKHVHKLRSKITVPPVMDNHSPCPFLTKGSCSIYNVRPFVCRRHVTLTPDSYWCHPDRCHDITLTLPRFTEVDKVYEQILFESGQLAKRTDIRDIQNKRALK